MGILVRRLSGLDRRNIMLTLARTMIENHGEGAEAEAERRSREYFEKDDKAGSAAWEAVADAIREARNMIPPGKVH